MYILYNTNTKIKEKIDVCKRKGIKESRIKFKKFDATYKIRQILLYWQNFLLLVFDDKRTHTHLHRLRVSHKDNTVRTARISYYLVAIVVTIFIRSPVPATCR